MTAPAHTKAVRPVHVVFVHGLWSSQDTWTAFRQALAVDSGTQEVSAHCFTYDTPVVRLRPDRAIAQFDDIADQLSTFLRVQIPDDGLPVVLVSHSQGGLIIQRFLARTVQESRGSSLARIKGIVMYACPNNGSGFFLTARRSMWFWRNPQERQLRPYQREVLETQRTVMRAVVQATDDSAGQWRIPIQTYGAASDRVVPAREARGVFPDGGVVDGDHSSVVRPKDREAASYRVLKDVLVNLAPLTSHPVPNGRRPEPGLVPAPAPEPVEPVWSAPVPLSPPPVPARTPSDAAADPAPSPPQQQWSGTSVSPPYGRQQGRLRGEQARRIVSEIITPPADSAPPIRVLTGLGGSGKSRIALEAAHRARETRRVWWVTVAQINIGMRAIARELRVPDGEVEQAFRGEGSPMDLIWRYLEASPEPWLLIIDNVDTPDRLGPLDGEVSDGTGWVRRAMNADGLVILTSRDRRAADWLPPCTVHQVPPLTDEDGADLLLECAPHGGSREQARLLSAELGGLPLALRGAAAYVKAVREASISLDDPMFQDFDGYRETFRSRVASPPGTAASGLSEIMDLSTMSEVCGIALDLLTKRGLSQAGPLLRAFACLGIAPIPYRPLMESQALAPSGLFVDFPRTQRIAVLKGLEDLGLVETVSRPGAGSRSPMTGLVLHPVVHALLRGDKDVERRRADYYGLNVGLLLDITRKAPPDVPESWDIWTAVAPHAMEVVNAALLGPGRLDDTTVVRRALELARLTARYLIVVGLLRPAHEQTGTIIARCEYFGFRPDDREILGLRHEMGRIALESGDHARAETELRQVVADRERVLGPGNTDTLASRHKLARSILEQGRYAEAAPLLRSVVDAELVARGADDSDTVTVQHSLARAMFALGRHADAEKELRAILAVSLRLWSPTTTETLRIRQTLARCLLETRRPDEAEAEIRQALTDTQQGQDSPLTMSLRFTRCQVLLIQGQIARARTEAADLVDDRTRVLGPEHSETLRTRRLLANVQSIPDPPSGEE